MFEQWTKRPWWMLGLGLLGGLLFGAGMTVGVLIGTSARTDRGLRFPETLLHATASDGSDTMAIATGAIDEEVEGFFVLDFITGELQCSVLNPRTGQLGGLYRHNVVRDLGIEQGKQPKYLMVTGLVDFRTYGGNVRAAHSVVYVADSNTGRYAAYMLPWDRNAASYNVAQANPMIILGKGVARNIQLE